MFADDTALVAHKHKNQNKNHLEICKGILAKKINLKKTDVMYQLPPVSHKIDQDLLVEGQVLTQVNKFKHLGSIFNNSDNLDTERDT